MRRGEIWTAAGGGEYVAKPRPVLIVQDDAFAQTDSVLICPLTSHAVPAEFVRPALTPTAANGLRDPSWAMVDKLTTVRRIRLKERVGSVSPATLRTVNRAIALFLGLSG